jgi:two-component system cell cycle sensor histidine kinase/response regulator CckA
MLEAILESAGQGILATDESGAILLVNRRVVELFGYTEDELLGQPVETLLPLAARGIHRRHRGAYSAAPHVRPMGVGLDLAGRKKDGTEFSVEISLSYIRNEQGIVAIAFISDISHRKQLEEQVLQSQKMEAIGKLAGGIAHDFNNLLTVISGYDRLLLNALSPFEPLRGYAEEIAKAAERAASLTKQLLAFSRRQIITPRIWELNSVIRDARNLMERLVAENIELVSKLRPGVGNVRVDKGQIEQVLINLVLNARDAMPNGGRITIETDDVDLGSEYARTHLGVKPGRYVMFAVSDTGAGMDAETRKHIFEPFFTTKPAEKGTGLGLATVYGIVKQNGGDIWVYTELGRGTTFKVYLPRVEEAADAADPPAAPPEPGHETILVAEDESGLRRLIVQILQSQGYEVIEAENVNEAVRLNQAHAGRVHLLLTDVVMPEMSGRQLADAIRAVNPNIKIIYMSGYTENTVVHHGVLESEIDFLPKPFTFEALLEKVRAVLSR